MADECIKRDNAKRAFAVAFQMPENMIDAVWIQEVLDAIPAADVRPVVRGRWIVIETERSWNCAEYPTRVKCSNCEHEMPYLDKGDFCSSCGAMMDGEG